MLTEFSSNDFDGQFEAASAPVNSSAVVSGAGTAAANGTYTPRGTHNSRPYYNLTGQPDDTGAIGIIWTTTQWRITGEGETVLYESNDDVAFPWLVITWAAQEGSEPVPTVSQG